MKKTIVEIYYKQVLKLANDGISQRHIADKLKISQSTVCSIISLSTENQKIKYIYGQRHDVIKSGKSICCQAAIEKLFNHFAQENEVSVIAICMHCKSEVPKLSLFKDASKAHKIYKQLHEHKTT